MRELFILPSWIHLFRCRIKYIQRGSNSHTRQQLLDHWLHTIQHIPNFQTQYLDLGISTGISALKKTSFSGLRSGEWAGKYKSSIPTSFKKNYEELLWYQFDGQQNCQPLNCLQPPIVALRYVDELLVTLQRKISKIQQSLTHLEEYLCTSIHQHQLESWE